jgi:type I restriction enzyme S subunit
MIAELEPYPDYKHSDEPWLGRIPAHWNVQKLKHLTRFVNGLPFKPGDWRESGTPIIRIQNLNGSKKFNFTRRTDLPSELLINPGDLLFSWSGNRGTSFGPFIWNHDCAGYLNQHIFKLAGYGMDTNYFAYLLRAVTRHIEEEKTHGIIGLVHVTKPELGSARVPTAPPDEQRKIAQFLDWATKRIDRTVRSKNRVIRLLNEQKASVTQSAVTTGFNASAPLRDSGIAWLGRIPSHWNVVRIKCLLREVDERSTTGDEPLLSMRMYHGLVLFAEHFSRAPQAKTLVGFKVVKPGQFVVNRMQAGNGLIFASTLSGLVSPDYAVFDPIGDTDVTFIGELFRCRKVRAKFRSESKGLGTGTSGFLRLYTDRFGAIHVALPPTPEQRTILQGLSLRVAGVNKAISRLEREVELLTEYRARLIGDVITGKLDVREAAGVLPDEDLNADNVIEQDSVEIDEEGQEFAEEGLAK